MKVLTKTTGLTDGCGRRFRIVGVGVGGGFVVVVARWGSSRLLFPLYTYVYRAYAYIDPQIVRCLELN